MSKTIPHGVALQKTPVIRKLKCIFANKRPPGPGLLHLLKKRGRTTDPHGLVV
jgi:hypothetical protein